MDRGVLALALLAGAVAAFNPCGFALLPAYLSLLVADGPRSEPPPAGARGTLSAVRTAVRFTSGMTVGFVAVFGVFGAVIAPLALSVERYLPYLTVVIGVVLVLLGGWLLAGRALTVPGLAGRGFGPTRSWWSQVGYGVSFALASLSCTIGPFLAVTSTSLRGSTATQVMASYIAYALGMGTIILVLALAAATAQATAVTRMRRAGAYIGRVSGALLVVAGAYVAWYGWFEVRVLSGSTTDDAVVDAALRVQGYLTRLVADAGAGVLLVVLLGLVCVIAVPALVRWAARRRPGRGSQHLVDGGDLACGELLMRLVSRMDALPAGDVVQLVATDPAAPLDIPAWCHLTGHAYLGPGQEDDGRPHYDIEVCARAVDTRPGQPWRLAEHTPPPKGNASL